jgi:dipeptidyl aminopeptidase/acylaminoacyl peptidase
MEGPVRAPCGSWRSPITTELITASTVGLHGLQVVDSDLYWLEARPTEAGRVVLVRRGADGRVEDLTPAPVNVRTRVHEYGGGAYRADSNGWIYSDFADSRVYLQGAAGDARAITPGGALRYADFEFDRRRGRVYCVREDHRSGSEPQNGIVSLSVSAGKTVDEGKVLARGADFYAYPRVSPQGDRLAWLCWHHPNMPWDGTELWVARLDEDELHESIQIAGGPQESISEPQWDADGSLVYLSDRSGFSNPYRWDGRRHHSLCGRANDFGGPLWSLGGRSCVQLADGCWLFTFVEGGAHRLTIVDASGSETPIEVEASYFEGALPVADGRLAVICADPLNASRVALLDPKTGALEVLRESLSERVPAEYVSVAEPIEFPTEGGLTAHAFFYPPTNRDFVAPEDERPPLLVLSHGGPTGATSNAMSFKVQFWTSRGFAVVDVNYGGSTGYGRAYRERLAGAWGIVDVDDCANAARHLAATGRIDPERACIRGGSAGGYTTLASLTFRDVFRAGASHYGIGDLSALARDTHKFESRYLDGLIGPWPEASRLYEDRSPIHHCEALNRPVIFFQGSEDRVVPPNQAEAMVEALNAKGLPVGYLLFEGDGHGFRSAENIERALEAELYFYGKVLGFEPADPIEPVEILNLD